MRFKHLAKHRHRSVLSRETGPNSEQSKSLAHNHQVVRSRTQKRCCSLVVVFLNVNKTLIKATVQDLFIIIAFPYETDTEPNVENTG